MKTLTQVEITIVDRVAQFVRRFVFLKEPAHYRLIALWIIGTHQHQAFDYFGYLFINSPEKQSGKTRLMEVLNHLSYKSTSILVSPTEATLFRTAHDRTQLLDEIDSWARKENCIAVLNAGFQRGAIVPRMEQQSVDGKYKEQTYPVYAPRALAGIGVDVLSDTTRDRTFSVQMLRKTKYEPVERFRTRLQAEELRALTKAIKSFALEHRDRIQLRYDTPHFPYLKQFTDRTEDICEPLAAILEEVYADHPARDDALNDFVHAIAITRDEPAQSIRNREVLQLLMNLAELEDPLVGSARELELKCSRPEDSTLVAGISDLLSKYGFKTKSIRQGGEPRKRYSIGYTALKEIHDRYFETT